MLNKYFKDFLKCYIHNIYIQQWEQDTRSDLKTFSTYQLIELKKQIKYSIHYLHGYNTNNFNTFFGNLLAITGSLFVVLVPAYTSISDTFNELYSFCLEQENFINARIIQSSKQNLMNELLDTFVCFFIVLTLLILFVFVFNEIKNKYKVIKILYYTELLKIVNSVLKVNKKYKSH